MYCHVHIWSSVGRQYQMEGGGGAEGFLTTDFPLILLLREHFRFHGHLTINERHVDTLRPAKPEALQRDTLRYARHE